MQLEKYTFTTDDNNFTYEFYSAGPKGSIKKVVQFARFNQLKTETYNIVFGDWNEVENRIDDLINTNNGDRDKVLATVGAIVIHFMVKLPHVNIFATGSTPSRNRLYRIGLSKVLEEIKPLYYVRGYIEGEWRSFLKGTDYIAFLLLSK
jgi:hypothetical protein